MVQSVRSPRRIADRSPLWFPRSTSINLATMKVYRIESDFPVPIRLSASEPNDQAARTDG